MRVADLVKTMQGEYRAGVADEAVTAWTKTEVWSENIKGALYSIGIRVIPGVAPYTITVIVTYFVNKLISNVETETCDATIEALRELITKHINSCREEEYARIDYLLKQELEMYVSKRL